MDKLKRQAEIVEQRLQHHFVDLLDGGFNIPDNMPFMAEFLLEIKKLCALTNEADVVLTDKKFKGAINQAFRKGESWGVTYSTWFTPTEVDKDAKREEAITKAYKIVNDKE